MKDQKFLIGIVFLLRNAYTAQLATCTNYFSLLFPLVCFCAKSVVMSSHNLDTLCHFFISIATLQQGHNKVVVSGINDNTRKIMMSFDKLLTTTVRASNIANSVTAMEKTNNCTLNKPKLMVDCTAIQSRRLHFEVCSL